MHKDMEKLLANSILDETTGCRIWQGCIGTKGYGHIKRADSGRHGKVWRTHRLMWTLVNGDIPTGALLLHSCHNPACINIEHLRLGDNQENMNDMKAAGRQNKCKGSGHGESKLTETIIKEIFELYSQGYSLRRLGCRYGVTFGTIWKVLKGRTWVHVDNG
jgi:hypothetical protein